MTEKYEGVTPVGRLISEAIFTPTSKGYQNKKLDTPVYYIQVAIAKTPECQALVEIIRQCAAVGFPNGEFNRPDFAWKFKDGDTAPNNSREGWAGCYIFTFRSGFAPQAIVDEKNMQIIDTHQLKPGYQVCVAYSIKSNGNLQKPGVYLNFHMVKRIAVDAVIVSGPSAAEVFGNAVTANPLQGKGPITVPTVPIPSGIQPDPAFLQTHDPTT